MKVNWFIAERISSTEKSGADFSRPVIRIATGGIILGVAVMILTIFIVKGFQKEVKDRAIAFCAHLQLINKNDLNSGESLPILQKQPIIEKLKKNKDVHHVQQFLLKNGIIKTKTENEGVIVKGIGENFVWGYIGNNIISGRTFLPNKSPSGEFPILISAATASRLQVKPQDKIILYFIVPDTLIHIQVSGIDTIVKQEDKFLSSVKKLYPEEEADIEKQINYLPRSRAFRISGIYETGLEDFDKKMVFTTEDALKKIYRWPDTVTGGFEIYLNDFSEVEKFTEEIYFQLRQEDNLDVLNVREKNQGIFEWLDMHDTTALIVLTLMISVAIINMTSALIILIIEKVSLIGMLKALGMDNRSIRSVFLIQAAKIISKGILLGNFLGLFLAFLQWKFQLFKLDQTVYYMPFVPIKFEWDLWALLNVFTFIACFAFMLLPAIIVSRTSPLKAIKFSGLIFFLFTK